MFNLDSVREKISKSTTNTMWDKISKRATKTVSDKISQSSTKAVLDKISQSLTKTVWDKFSSMTFANTTLDCYQRYSYNNSLRKHLRTYNTFIVDQIIKLFFNNYHQFPIKSYVVPIY